VTSTLACVMVSVGDDAWFSVAVWTMLALDYAVEIYEGFHYSVDMWLGCVVVSLLWRVLQPVEGMISAKPTSSRQGNSEPIAGSKPSLQQVVLYACPGVLAYLQLVLFPKWSSNFLIVGYLVFVVFLFAQFVFRQPPSYRKTLVLHYGQHTVLCLLYMALGVYL